jgi:hypothetical protein
LYCKKKMSKAGRNRGREELPIEIKEGKKRNFVA